jgi:hypothetical protein
VEYSQTYFITGRHSSNIPAVPPHLPENLSGDSSTLALCAAVQYNPISEFPKAQIKVAANGARYR